MVDKDSNKKNKLKYIDGRINEEIQAIQRNNNEDNRIKLQRIEKEKGKTAEVFKQKELITGCRKGTQEIIAVQDRESNKLVTDAEQIKKLVLQYCKTLLTNRDPKAGFVSDIKSKKSLHEARMAERDIMFEKEFSYEKFIESFTELAKKKGKKYNFLTKSGNSFRGSLY